MAEQSLIADRGGRFRIAPEGEGHTTRQAHLGDTAVLMGVTP